MQNATAGADGLVCEGRFWSWSAVMDIFMNYNETYLGVKESHLFNLVDVALFSACALPG